MSTDTLEAKSTILKGGEFLLKESKSNNVFTPEDFTFGCSDNVIVVVGNCSKTSVELVDFDGRAENSGNFVYWSTATELNSKMFRLESSTNGVDFKTIATVDAAGNSNVLNSYDVLDTNASAGVTYYRLTEIDVNGGETQYNTISVERNNDVRTTITIAPVPVQNVLNIQLNNQNPIDAQIQLFDVSGKLVRVITVDNTSSVSVNVEELTAGTYFVVLTSEAESTTTRFVKK